MMDPDPPIRRVIDLIANLQNHDPVAPVQVWLKSLNGYWEPRQVIQVTPDYCRQTGIQDPRPGGSGPFPVVVLAE